MNLYIYWLVPDIFVYFILCFYNISKINISWNDYHYYIQK